jgi:hypothetical protein
MRSCARRLSRLVLVVVAVSASVGLASPPASAAPGSVLRDLTVPNSVGGVSVAFDGHHLYYTNLDGAVLHRVAPSGAAATDIPIVGAAGINALSYDAMHDVFWGVDRSGLAIYSIRKDGVATPRFTLTPAFDLPGLCDAPLGCNRIVSGLAYDASDSLWYAPQGSERIYHFTITGRLLSSFDTNDGASALVPDCLTNGVSGIAAGKSSLFLSAGTCGRAFQYAKNDSGSAAKLGTFNAPSAGDVECDDVTFEVHAVWVRGASDGHLRALEIPAGMCTLGGGTILDNTKRWMSGSGTAIAEFDAVPPTIPPTTVVVPVPHTLTYLLCDQENVAAPRAITASWTTPDGKKYIFELTRLESTTCFSDGGNASCPPDDTQCFNSIVGSGVGNLFRNGKKLTGPNCGNDCGSIGFRFNDNGPPKTGQLGQLPPFDEGQFTITDLSLASPDAILVACGCDKADYRAHRCGEPSRS